MTTPEPLSPPFPLLDVAREPPPPPPPPYLDPEPEVPPATIKY